MLLGIRSHGNGGSIHQIDLFRVTDLGGKHTEQKKHQVVAYLK